MPPTSTTASTPGTCAPGAGPDLPRPATRRGGPDLVISATGDSGGLNGAISAFPPWPEHRPAGAGLADRLLRPEPRARRAAFAIRADTGHDEGRTGPHRRADGAEPPARHPVCRVVLA